MSNNFIKIKQFSIPCKHYAYIDCNSYLMDGLLEVYGVPVAFLDCEMTSKNSDLVVSFLKCPRVFSRLMEKKVFPMLHTLMSITYSDSYAELLNLFDEMVDKRSMEVD